MEDKNRIILHNISEKYEKVTSIKSGDIFVDMYKYQVSAKDIKVRNECARVRKEFYCIRNFNDLLFSFITYRKLHQVR